MKTIIFLCDCTHEYQDKTYGKNKRVHNIREVPHDKEAYCMVCGKLKEIK